MVTMLPEIEPIDYVALAPMATLEETGTGISPEATRHFSKGIILSGEGKYREAVHAYGRGLNHAKAVPQAWYNKGTALAALGRYEEAQGAFDQAVRLKPDYFEAWHNMGVAFTRLGRHQDALRAFERTLGQRSDDAQAWLCIGTVLMAKQETEAAIDAFEKARGYAETEPLAWLNIGVALVRLRNYAEANHAFQRAFDLKDGRSIWETALYKAWASSTLALGVNALMNQDIRTFEEAGLGYIEILEQAQQANAGQVVDDALLQIKGEVQQTKKRKVLKAFEELELFIDLMKIKDPFEGWRALSKEISKVWPKGLSAVDAIREQRDREWNT